MKTQILIKKVEQAPLETQKLIAQILEASPSFQNSLAKVLATVSQKKPFDTIIDVLAAKEILDQLAPDDPLATARLKGVQRKRDLLFQEGLPLTSEEVATLLEMTRQGVDKRRRNGQLLGVSLGKRGYRYPLWQFQDGKVMPRLEQVLAELAEYDPWTQLIFFKTGDIRLGGATPLERLQAGDIDKVVWRFLLWETHCGLMIFTGTSTTPCGFFSRNLPILQSCRPWFRLNPVQHPSTIYFDRSGKGRFDGKNQGYGILYLGETQEAAFIECYGRVHGAIGVAEKDLKQRNLFSITASRNLVIVDLTGSNLVKIGADARLSTGSYLIARTWAKAIWQHPMKVDGIRYRSRHDDECFCYGLFDRVKSDLREDNLGNLVDHHALVLSRILERYDYALL